MPSNLHSGTQKACHTAAQQRCFTGAAPSWSSAGERTKNCFSAGYGRQKSCLQNYTVAPGKLAALQRSSNVSPVLLRAGPAPGSVRNNVSVQGMEDKNHAFKLAAPQRSSDVSPVLLRAGPAPG